MSERVELAEKLREWATRGDILPSHDPPVPRAALRRAADLLSREGQGQLREAVETAVEKMAGPLGRARSRALDGVSDVDQMRDLDLVADGVKQLRALSSTTPVEGEGAGRATVTMSAEPPKPRPPHDHDSTRLDGWLDNCCMYCGADGHWLKGERIDPEGRRTKTHPSGKTLVWPALNGEKD